MRRNFNSDLPDDGWNGLGGYMGAKNQKLEQQFEQDRNRLGQVSNIFNHVSVYVNGFTQPTANEIKAIMAQHGGHYSLYYSRKTTTHIIAESLAGVKLRNLKPGQYVVKPQWIVDSLKERVLLPIKSYIFAAYSQTGNQKALSEMFDGQLSNTAAEGRKYDKISSTETKKLSMTETTSEDFISEFYSNSRLHFLSTWKLKLTEYVRKLTEENRRMIGYEQLLEKALNNSRESEEEYSCCDRIIMHIDMDCFFVSASLLSRPHLKEKAVAVTHRSKGKQDRPQCSRQTDDTSASSYAEIASCSYKARQAGVKNGMFFGQAKKLCPDLIPIPYDFETYKGISLRLYDVVASYTLNVEAVSCDELLVDLTELVSKLKISPLNISEHMRQRIFAETKCTASAGVGPNIVLAKMATKHGKPNGQYQINRDQAQSFLADVHVKELPGVGRKTERKLEQLGVTTCGELRCLTLSQLQSDFGTKTGKNLFDLSRGVDDREVMSVKLRKSVSADINYGIRLRTQHEVEVFLKNLAKEVSTRMGNEKLRGGKITLKVKVRAEEAPVEPRKYGGHGVCSNLSASAPIIVPTSHHERIADEAILLMASLKIKPCDLRGIGIQMTQLEPESAAGGRSGVESSRSAAPTAAATKSFAVKGRGKTSPRKFGSPRKQLITNFLVRSPLKTNSFAFLEKKSGDVQQQSEPVDAVKAAAADVEEVGAVTNAQAENNRTVAEHRPETSSLDCSFLLALPDDLRKEVAGSMALQREAFAANKTTTKAAEICCSTPLKKKAATVLKGSASLEPRGEKEVVKDEEKLVALLNSFANDDDEDGEQQKETSSGKKPIKKELFPREPQPEAKDVSASDEELVSLLDSFEESGDIPDEVDPQHKPSSSSIDESFLRALPDDVRREVEGSMKQQKEAMQTKVSTCASSLAPSSSVDKGLPPGGDRSSNENRCKGEGAGQSTSSSLQAQLNDLPKMNEAYGNQQRQPACLDESFLRALPDDIREEVEGNMKQQREAYNRAAVHPAAPVRGRCQMTTTEQQRNFFQVKTKQQTSAARAAPQARRSRRGRPPGSKNKKPRQQHKSPSKRRVVLKSDNNMKISDIFQVVKKGDGSSSSGGGSQSSQDTFASLTSSQHTNVTDKNVNEAGYDADDVGDMKVVEWHPQEPTAPNLGGATEIEEVRRAVKSWVEQFAHDYPHECDVEQVQLFLRRTVMESCNLELASQTTKSLHRAISKAVLARDDGCFLFVDAQGQATVAEWWRQVYRRILGHVQQAVDDKYGNTVLCLPVL